MLDITPIKKYGQTKQWSAALQLLREGIQSGAKLSPGPYIVTASACRKGGQWHLALSLISEMWEGKLEPDVIKSCERIIVTGNVPEPLPVDLDDRRWPCFELMDTDDLTSGNPMYFSELAASLDETCAVHLRHFLLRRDLSSWNARDIPRTPWREHLQAVSQPPAAAFLQDMIENCQYPSEPIACIKMFEAFQKWAGIAGHDVRMYTDRRFFLELNSLCGVASRSAKVDVDGEKKNRRCYSYGILPGGDAGAVLLTAQDVKEAMIKKKAWAQHPGDVASSSAVSDRVPTMAGTNRGRYGGTRMAVPMGLFVDPQVRSLCAVHALRNATQNRVIFTEALLFQGAKAAAAALGEHVCFHADLASADNFSIEAISYAVGLTTEFAMREIFTGQRVPHGEPSECVDVAFSVDGEAQDAGIVLGMIMHVPGHYVAWRRENGQLILLDSLQPSIVEVCSPDVFVDLVRKTRKRVNDKKIVDVPMYPMWQILRVQYGAKRPRSA